MLFIGGKIVYYNNKFIRGGGASPPGPDLYQGYWVDKNTGEEVIFTVEGNVYSSPSYLQNASEIFIPEGISSISSNAFSGAQDLQTVILPSSLNLVGDNAFNNTPGLINLYINATTPPSFGVLGNMGSNFEFQIKAPAQSYDLYKNALPSLQSKLFVLNDLIPGSRVHDGYSHAATGVHLNGQSDVVIEGLHFDENTEFELYQWQRGAILLEDCNNVTIRNCKFSNLSTRAFSISRCSNISIYNCNIHECWAACLFRDSRGNNRIFSCDIRNIRGVLELERDEEFGNAVQFMDVGDSSETRYLYGGDRAQDLAIECIEGFAEPEDLFSVYKGWYNPDDPYIIRNNWIRGGSLRTWGVGMQIGDNGGAGVTMSNNIMVYPGASGISISGGHDISVVNNIIYNDETYVPSWMKALQSWIYVPDQFPVNNRTMSNNRVYWANQDEPYDIGEGVNPPIGFDTNIFKDTTLSEEVLPQHIIGVRPGGLGPIDPFNPGPQPAITGGYYRTSQNQNDIPITADSDFIKRTLFFVLGNWPPITFIVIPEGVTHVLGKAFQGQSELTSVSFPSTTEAIGERVLQGATSLETVYCHAITPPHLSPRSNPTESLGIPTSQTIRVPSVSVNSYLQHPIWGMYNIVSI